MISFDIRGRCNISLHSKCQKCYHNDLIDYVIKAKNELFINFRIY